MKLEIEIEKEIHIVRYRYRDRDRDRDSDWFRDRYRDGLKLNIEKEIETRI